MDVDVPINTEASPISLQSLQKRYILTRTGNQQLVFPTQWVAQIMPVERSQILTLPFYDRILLGLVHHQGNIVPLISSYILLSETLGQDVRFRERKNTLTVIRLAQSVDKLAGVGIVVEKIVGSFVAEPSPEQHIFQLSDLPNHIWQPHG